ncbi:MAG TPA: AAA family ATPase, partial [Isosphaeraceae bacterium]|nr:AAA family ATPase [Isosphaeraceae bacterium]
MEHITQRAGRIQCVSGWAGSGKTFMLDAARLAWEADGFTVHGAALSGKAARELSKGANLNSATIAQWIYDLDHPGRRDRLRRDSKSILVIDEAGMVGTRALHRLVTEVERAGA